MRVFGGSGMLGAGFPGTARTIVRQGRVIFCKAELGKLEGRGECVPRSQKRDPEHP
jgi:hypothetical protein